MHSRPSCPRPDREVGTRVRLWIHRSARGSVFVLLLPLSLLLPNSSFRGQATGTITGVVTNAVSGEAIPGAQISMPGRGLGTQADNVGRYVLVDVPVGPQVIRAESIGFSAQEDEVEVTPAGRVVMDFTLRSEAFLLSFKVDV
jgi:hypothetical protein